jgi:hypothetical protein
MFSICGREFFKSHQHLQTTSIPHPLCRPPKLVVNFCIKTIAKMLSTRVSWSPQVFKSRASVIAVWIYSNIKLLSLLLCYVRMFLFSGEMKMISPLQYCCDNRRGQHILALWPQAQCMHHQHIIRQKLMRDAPFLKTRPHPGTKLREVYDLFLLILQWHKLPEECIHAKHCHSVRNVGMSPS